MLYVQRGSSASWWTRLSGLPLMLIFLPWVTPRNDLQSILTPPFPSSSRHRLIRRDCMLFKEGDLTMCGESPSLSFERNENALTYFEKTDNNVVRMRLRGGIGTPEPDPFSHAAALLGCTALAQDGAMDSEDELRQDMGMGGNECSEEPSIADEEGAYQEVKDEDREFDARKIRHEGRGYVGDGFEWVHDAPFKRAGKAGASASASYQHEQEDFVQKAKAKSGHQSGEIARGNLRVPPQQSWEKTGKNSLFAITNAARQFGPPPKLMPLSTVIAGAGAMRRFEGPKETEAQKMEKLKGSCVPRGEILSSEKELIEIWRDSNEFLIPHFARQEQAKCYQGGQVTGVKKYVPAPPGDKGRYPILTPMPDPDRLQELLPKTNDSFLLNMTYAQVLTKTLQAANGPQVDVVRSGWALKMLRFMSTRKSGGRLTESGVDASSAVTYPGSYQSWRSRPWLEANATSDYEEEEMGPVETHDETRDRRGQTTVAVLGTGRMGKKLAQVWAKGGFNVIIGSRDFTRGRLAAGEVSRLSGRDVEGGSAEWAARKGHVIVLATPFCETADLVCSLRPVLEQRGNVVLLDITNPAYDSQAIESTAGVDIHSAVLGSENAQWAVAYKSVFSKKIDFGQDSAQTIDICGDEKARKAVCDLVRSHGWIPRVRGGLEVAKDLEPGRRIAHIQQMYGTS